MNGKLDIKATRKELLEERYRFLEQELEYSECMCEILSKEDLFYRDLLEFTRCLLEMLRMLWKVEQSSDESKSADRDLIMRADEVYKHYPFLIQHLANSIRQRKASDLRFGSRKPHFAFSEVHPNYYLTARALETLNSDYHNSIKPLFMNYRSIPSMINIAYSPEFALLPFPPREFMQLASDLSDDTRQRLVRYQLTLSWMLVPRWIPSYFGFEAFLAHEHFHRVFNYVFFAREEFSNMMAAFRSLGSKLEKEDSILAAEIEEVLATKFGRGFKSIYASFAELQESLRELYESIASYDEANYFLRGSQARKLGIETAKEILCDIGALYIAGAPFLCAILFHPLVLDGDLSLLKKRSGSPAHLPFRARVRLLLWVSRQLGFVHFSDRVEAYFTELEKDIEINRWDYTANDALKRWIGSNETQDILSGYTLSLKQLLPDSLGNALSEGKQSEDQWDQMQEKIARDVVGGRSSDSVHNGAEILAAYWHRVIYEGSEPVNCLPWRFAISDVPRRREDD